MAKLTVTEALVKLKLTNKKIADAQQKLHFGIVATRGSKTVAPGFNDNEQYKSEIKSRLDSVTGLIKYRDSLKRAIIASNASTRVQIGSKTMTVADAIDFKQSLATKRALYEYLSKNLAVLNANVERANANLDARADDYVAKMFAGSASTEEDRKKARENWVEANRSYPITHESLKQFTEQLGEEINEFTANADVTLSVVNAKTEIEVE